MNTVKEAEPVVREDIPATLPVIPLRDVVIFPHMIFPILVGRESSIRAVTAAIEADKYIFVCSQKNPLEEEPKPDDLYAQGSVAKILQVLKLPTGYMKVLVDGLTQATASGFVESPEGYFTAAITIVTPRVRLTTHLRALLRQLDLLFEEYVKLHRDIPNETLIAYEGLSDPLRKVYYVASNLLIGVPQKMQILSSGSIQDQIYEVVHLLSNEIDIMKVEQEIDDRVHANIQSSQRRYFIQEQIRMLQQELDEGEGESRGELDELIARVDQATMPDDARAKAREEIAKLEKMAPMSPEATVSRNWLDWMLAMPWGTFSRDNLSVRHASSVLNADHYGLGKPKQRILEHIAVLNLVGEMRGQILCFVGPPGVGKTSLGKSIARALDRSFVRISLGGVHDEAEIRGHRRTYIGSMPGKIIQAIKKAGVANPVVLLDEIDKMSSDFQGDPAAAMLEVLDPEQNNTFTDHYLDVDFDLSKVLFITTANVRWNIPLPLQDRMEIIELPGYLEHEKLEIAKRHLVAKQLAAHGLTRTNVVFEDDALMKIIREYTLEAGVRNLERNIAAVCRKIAKEVVSGRNAKRADIRVTSALVEKHLGVPKQRARRIRFGAPGSVTGLAWTSAGGDVLRVDVTLMKGPEKLTLTGQLGDVMKESAHAALSYLRSNAAALGLPDDFAEKKEIHIHIPEGAIPKDGPSAGITMAIAMYSAIRGLPAREDVAMTGEITLHGDVLAIGGLNEKLLAARRHGITTVIVPKENGPDLKEVLPQIRKGLAIVQVSTVAQALPLVFDSAAGRTAPPSRRRAGRKS